MGKVLIALLAVAIACGGDAPTTPSGSVSSVGYQLTDLFYEDVIPGQYHLTISSFAGGPAVLVFREDSTGALEVAADGTAVVVDQLTGQSQVATILTAGTVNFTYVLADTVVTFSPTKPWPLGLPSVLTYEDLRQEARTCYDETCEDRTVLTARWVRQ